jgi:steroid delta-isomerase-like uncharacterized protein
MFTADLEAVLDTWAAAWSSHDAEKLLPLFTDDCMYEDVTFGVVMHGKDQLRAFAKGAFAAVPDIRFDITTRFASGRWATIEWEMSGTHKGDFPGLPATGKRFSGIRGATIIEIENGRIRRNSDYWDAAAFMKQVGLLP